MSTFQEWFIESLASEEIIDLYFVLSDLYDVPDFPPEVQAHYNGLDRATQAHYCRQALHSASERQIARASERGQIRISMSGARYGYYKGQPCEFNSGRAYPLPKGTVLADGAVYPPGSFGTDMWGNVTHNSDVSGIPTGKVVI